mmetsp:Transcript_9863/g.39989  ORF Transcript_9863/g.39989 Transcript_9863/m.39989 type:complete len:320 (+) Transcript_9863:318-1277(+)
MARRCTHAENTSENHTLQFTNRRFCFLLRSAFRASYDASASASSSCAWGLYSRTMNLSLARTCFLNSSSQTLSTTTRFSVNSLSRAISMELRGTAAVTGAELLRFENVTSEPYSDAHLAADCSGTTTNSVENVSDSTIMSGVTKFARSFTARLPALFLSSWTTFCAAMEYSEVAVLNCSSTYETASARRVARASQGIFLGKRRSIQVNFWRYWSSPSVRVLPSSCWTDTVRSARAWLLRPSLSVSRSAVRYWPIFLVMFSTVWSVFTRLSLSDMSMSSVPTRSGGTGKRAQEATSPPICESFWKTASSLPLAASTDTHQ